MSDLSVALSVVDGAFSVGALVFALLAVYAVTRRRHARLAVGGFLAFAVLKTVVAVVLLANFGVLFALDKLLVTAPAVLLPSLALAAMTWPALRRPAAAGPGLVTPAHVAVVGAAADIRYDYFTAPQPPYFGSLLLVAGLLALTAAVSTLLRKSSRTARYGAVVLLGLGPVLGGTVQAVATSGLPGSYSMAGDAMGSMDMAGMDMGTRSVAGLTGPPGPPDVRFTLTASRTRVVAGGLAQDALTFNGTAPGPQLRVRQGQLVEVTLINHDVPEGVTVHWHGLNVPNAEDGVAGVTQDAVPPGGSFVYRFRPAQTGTFWYHSHQDSRAEVERGLYGALIVDPPSPEESTLDITELAHSWPDVNTLEKSIVDQRRAAPGQRVRVRLINTDAWPVRFAVSGAPFTVTAIDGNAVHDPGELSGQGLLIPAGGRDDILLTMPSAPVTIKAFMDARNRRPAARGIADPSLVLSTTGDADPAPVAEPRDDVDFSAYGTPAPMPFDANSTFAEQPVYYFDYRLFGAYNGGLMSTYTLNGEVFPATPMLMVHEGDLVRMTFVNRSPDDHAMHLHGHTLLVLSRDGKAVSGSPWWTDSLNVAPGETYVVAFKADNPGVWMDHCHNFVHAAGGMTMHLAYEGVTDPYRAGPATGNRPE